MPFSKYHSAQDASTFPGLLPVLTLILIFIIQTGQSQLTYREMEDNLKLVYGYEKLDYLNQLSAYYNRRYSRKAIRYGKDAEDISTLLIDTNPPRDSIQSNLIVQGPYVLAEAYYKRENYFEAKESYQRVLDYSERLNIGHYRNESEEQLARIQAMIDAGEIKEGFFSRTLSDLKIGSSVEKASEDLAIKAKTNSAEKKYREGDLAGAISLYEQAINLLRNQGNQSEIATLQIKVAELLDSLQRYQDASDYLDAAITESRAKVDPVKQLDIDSMASIEYEHSSLIAERDASDIDQQKADLKRLSDAFSRERDPLRSEQLLREIRSLNAKILSDSLFKNQQASELKNLKQQKQIADLNIELAREERARQIKLRNSSILVAIIILLSAMVILRFYFRQRRQHKRLTIAYRDLDKTKEKLETAEIRITKLLRQQVSDDVALALLTNGANQPVERKFVCIMFLDIRDFTPMAEAMAPEELIAYQNKVFGFMIDIVEKYKGNINQLLGDGFMATFGAPVAHGNECQNAYDAALEILAELKERNDAGIFRKTNIGVGLHAGNVVTGNVGNEARKQFSISGNPVIIASRVEQLNKTFKSNLVVTEEVMQRLDGEQNRERNYKSVKVKGRSEPIRIWTYSQQ